MEQNHVFVETGNHHLIFGKKFFKRKISYTCCLLLRLSGPAVVGHPGSHHLQRVRHHASRHAQTHNPHTKTCKLQRLLLPHGEIKPVENPHQLVHHVLHHAPVPVIPYAQNLNPMFPGIGDIHIGAGLRIQAAAHAHIADIGTLLQHALSNLGCIADQNAVRIPNPFYYLIFMLRNIFIQYHFLRVLLQFLLGGRNQAYRLYGH